MKTDALSGVLTNGRCFTLAACMMVLLATAASAAPLSSFAEKDKAGTVIYGLDPAKSETTGQSCLYDDKTCFKVGSRDKTGNVELEVERADGRKTRLLLPTDAQEDAMPHLWSYSLTLPALKAEGDSRAPIIIGVVNAQRTSLESGDASNARLSLYRLTFRGTAAEPLQLAEEILSVPHGASRDGRIFESMVTIDTANDAANPVLLYHGVATKGDMKQDICSFERRFSFNPFTARYEASEPGPDCPADLFRN